MEPALGAAAGLGRWLLGLQFCWFQEISRRGGSTQQPQRTEPYQCVSGQPWACHGALQGQMQPLQCEAGVVEPALGAAAGLGRWFVGVAVLQVCGDFPEQEAALCNNHSAHRALLVCEWPALGMPWGTARSNAASAVCSTGEIGSALGVAAWVLGR